MGPDTRRSPGTASLGSGRSRAHDGNSNDHGAGQTMTARTRGDLNLTNDHGKNGADWPIVPPPRRRPPSRWCGCENSRHPTRIEPIEWLLVTTLVVTRAEDAERIVTWYGYRRRIERWHFTWKTSGSHVKDLQLKAVSGWNGRSRCIPLSPGGSCG